PRLRLLWELLRDDGFLVVHIDDNEFARLYLLMADICQERNLKINVVKMAEPTGVKMSQVVKNGGIARLKEDVIFPGKSGIRGLCLERVAKDSWDDEYRTVVDNVSRAEMTELKDIITNKKRSTSEVQHADAICARMVFLTAEDVACRASGGTPTANWLQENAWRIVRTCATTAAAKRLPRQKRASPHPHPPP